MLALEIMALTWSRLKKQAGLLLTTTRLEPETLSEMRGRWEEQC